MRVVLQTRKTFQWQSVPVTESVWPPVTMCNLFSSFDTLAECDRHRRVDVAEQEIDIVALDQLARFLDSNAGIGARRILDQQLALAAEDAAFGIDLLDRQLAADLLVLAELGISAGQRIVEAELDLVGSASGNREGCRQLRDTGGSSSLDDSPTVELSRLNSTDHNHLLPGMAVVVTMVALTPSGTPYGHRAPRKESGFP